MSWPLVNLESVAHINPRLPKGTDESQVVTFLKMASVSEGGELLEQEKRILSETKKGFTYFEKDDVLLAKITPCFENGKAALLDDLETQLGFGSTEFHVLRAVEGKLDSKYLFHLVWNEEFRFLGKHAMKGAAGQQRISTDFLKNLKIPLPPLETQKQIAAVLEKADQLRKDCQQMEQELNSLAQSVFIDMFGDPVTNPKGWEISALDSIASVQLGKMLSSKSKQNVNPKKYLRNANIQWREVGIDDLLEMDFNEKEMKKFRLQRGDLLVCEGGEIGRCAIWNEQVQDCYYQKALHRVRINPQFLTSEYLQEYFFWMAKLGGLVNSTNEVTFKHLTAEKMNKLKVPLAPISKQKEFSEIYTSIRSELNNNVELMKEADAAFGAIMQKAFKGELNL
ncbi:restriction endonuclease subunit S [Vibrio mediterranei]|uniref:Type I restriction modification DNA specificity domain-containing protein n=1 Tax=Vibrio mediterranei TaxID=689 RepID=A0A3G4VFH8_9VIBR|nr:restriction endonuclease subunit S [Vibrio mediterranei]AYV23520.1 hypothetical protein ECB94_19700 [Vibrio mediterranei]